MHGNWARVKEILSGALERDAADLDRYFDDVCAGDAALRAEVEALLAGRHRAAGFLETPAADLLTPPHRIDDLSGRTIATYRLVSRLGAGGMGEVYLAHDAKLERPVALKFLSADLAAAQSRLRRFHQEARAASSLNHPQILVVHDFGEFDGRPYIVTEFVEGETVRERLNRGPLAVADVVSIGTQTAGALAAAHARGLVHRDIKPENVMVRPDGYVKVLDFGLAKLADRSAAWPDSASHTQPGIVVGTPRYMSPEQARGMEVDARSDVWSLGVLLYETITGRPPFDGATPADAVAAILTTEPPPLEPPEGRLHPAVAAIVTRALRKNRDDRYADAGEMLADFRRLPGDVLAGARGSDSEVDERRDDDVTLSPAGERRRVTVLVSVVSDYAELVERLAPADLDRIVGDVRAAAVDTIRRHGGVVNQSIGEEIVSLFGIPAAHEDDDLRAVRAALELHARTRDVAHRLGRPGVELRLQSGMHAGSVVAQRLREGPRRYSIAGSPVQMASRLAAAADPDAVLVSSDCHRLVRPFVRTEARAPIPLRRGAAPMTPYAVLGESGLDSRLDAAERAGLTPYAGRSAEFGTLQVEAAAARGGEGRVVFIVGEAGSGKSRMLHELRGTIADSNVQIVRGRCRSAGGMTSYLPFVEALRAILSVKEDDDAKSSVAQVVARIRAIDPSLERLIPLYLHLLSMPSDVFPLPRHLRGEHYQAAMLEALAAIFTSSVQRAPGVLLLEDWHWADDASRQALRHLVEIVAAYPLLIVVTSRPEPGALHDVPDHVVRINLGPLEPSASESIVKAVLGVEHMPGELGRRLHDRTGGNPFFLEEMCQALREAGAVCIDGAQVTVSGSADTLQLPDSVQAVIRSRLDRLNPEGREVLRVAAVIGREFPRRVLSDAMGGADVSAAIDQLKDAGIIRQVRVVPDPVYRFKHVLMQQVAYDSLVEHQRKSLHEAVGHAIARSQAGSFEQPYERLAFHFGNAEAWTDAIDYGMRAADRATELSQFADALAMLEQVHAWLEKLPADTGHLERLVDVLFRQERLCETLGLRARQLQLTADLISLLARQGASVRLAEAYLRQGDVSTLLKRFDAADRALATSLRMSRECGDAGLERNALRSIGLLRWHQGRHDDALAITETALAIDRQRQDDLAVAGDLSNLGNILRSKGDHLRALGPLEEALAMPAVASDPIKSCYIQHNIAQVYRVVGKIPEALEYLQRADDSARAHMLPIQRSFHLTSIAHILLQTGRIDESLRRYREAVDLSRRARHADGLAQSLRMLGDVLFGLGREAEALPYLQEAAQLFAQLDDRESEVVMRRYVALVLEHASSTEAIDAWERVRALAQTAGDARTELDALEGLGRATRATAPADSAVRWFDDALALAAKLGDRRREAELRNRLGILHWEAGAYGRALDHYERALALVRELDDRVHEGLALNSIGVTLSRLGRYEEARTALEEALAVNRATGERLLEAHTLAALGDIARARGRLDAARRAFESSLTIRCEIRDVTGERAMRERLAALGGEPAVQPASPIEQE